jgi:ribose-phosphate pyrophosphokinase
MASYICFVNKQNNMKLIDLNDGVNVSALLFPDQQPHVRVTGIEEGDQVRVIVSLTSSVKLLQLLQVSNALDHLFAKKKELIIPYLMAARYDRLMQQGDSLDLEVVANLINNCGFDKVILFDPHSEASGLLIRHSVSLTNRAMVEQYQERDAIVICPDAGAAKKTGAYLGWNTHLKEIVYCNKSRDLSTGAIKLEVLNADHCAGRNCVIIDDICDGGATFLAIAAQVQPTHMTLIVSHGIFSKGFSELEKRFQQIIVSDSFGINYNHPIVKTVNQPWFAKAWAR